MSYNNLPNVVGATDRIRTQLLQSFSGSFTTSTQPQTEITVPAVGDLIALEFTYTASLTGTVATAGSIDRTVQNVFMRDKNGVALINNIPGRIIYPVCERYNSSVPSLGVQRTIATVTGSAQTNRSVLPINIEREKLDGKLTITVNNIAGLDINASPTATGGSWSVDVTAWYTTANASNSTQRWDTVSIPIVSGSINAAPTFPQGVILESLYASITTESNITNYTLAPDQGPGFNLARIGDLIAMEQCELASGHLTGYVDFMVYPFVTSSQMTFNITGAGNDTLVCYFVKHFPSDVHN